MTSCIRSNEITLHVHCVCFICCFFGAMQIAIFSKVILARKELYSKVSAPYSPNRIDDVVVEGVTPRDLLAAALSCLPCCSH